MVRYWQLVLYIGNICAAPVITGPGSAGNTFPFPVDAYAFDQKDGRFFVGARVSISSDELKPFALSISDIGSSEFFPLAVETAEVNNEADQANPLFGQAIRFLDLLSAAPLVVLENDPTKVHYVYRYIPTSQTAIVSTNTLRDTQQNPIGQILSVATNPPRFYAVVSPNVGVFGDIGSGLVIGEFQKIRTSAGEQDSSFDFQLNQIQVHPLNRSTEAIRINSDAAAFHNDAQQPVSVYADASMPALYTGISATSGAAATDGVRSVMVNTNTVIAPDAAIGSDSIIGAIGSNVTVSAHFVRTLRTSTLLSYLVVVGGVGDSADTKRQVFALPVVNDRSSSGFATLAKRDAQPKNIFSEKDLLTGRVLTDAANAVDDLFTASDVEVQVGGGIELPGDITNIFAEKDAIFVSVAAATGAAEKGGLFYSQALFDSVGRIKGWTDWRRAGGEVIDIFGFTLSLSTGRFWFMTGPDAFSIDTIKRTQWTDAQSAIDLTFANSAMPAPGGIQHFVDIERHNPFLSQTVGNRISFIIESGFQTVSLVQSARDENGVFTPRTQAPLVNCSNGQLCANALDGYVVTGGALDELGAIITTDFVSDGTNSWLVVGGSGGIAVLMKQNGTGWTGTLQKNFAPLDASFGFKQVSDIPHVRKIIADDGLVYVLTDQQLVRFPASVSDFAAGQITATVLAEAGALPDGDHAFLLDGVISDKVALLATSSGMLRIGNGRNIRTATLSTISWQTITLPEGVGPVTGFHVISPTGRVVDIARDARGGTVYLANTYVGYHQTRIYRISIAQTANSSVGSETVTLLPDRFRERTVSFFLNRGDDRTDFAFDGATFFMTRSRYAPFDQPPFMEIMPARLRTGVSLAARGASIVVQNTQANRIYKPIRRSATGAWIVPYDAGIQTNQ